MKAFVVLLASSLALLWSARPANAQLVDGIEAIVHDTPITAVDVQTLSMPAAEMLRRQYAGQEQEFQTRLREVEKDNLTHLIDRQLILQEFKTYNVPETILDKDVNSHIEDMIRDTYYGDRMRLMKSLQAEGITYERFRQQIRERFIETALRQKNISSEIIISPHKIEAYYDAHKADYKVEEQVKLRMIVITNAPGEDGARKLAENILTKLNEGASFTEMAGVYSQGSQQRDKGEWGWVEIKVLRKELAGAAATLKPGQHSGVIAIQNPPSWYVMLVEDRRPAHFKPLADVRGDIENDLTLQERNRLEQQWIARLKKKTFVKMVF